MTLKIGLINASLPSYFPIKHGVFDACGAWLEELARSHGATVVTAETIPMNASEARIAVGELRAQDVDFVLLLHGGFTMGDVVREIARADLPMGVWSTPEPKLIDDIQLNNFVSLNMSMSIVRGVRDLAANPVQWYLGGPGDDTLSARIGQTIRALTARAALALREIATQGGYDALAVSDWPALQDNPGMHPGAAFSWLEECDHLPVASEGDILGAVTQLVAKSFTGKPGCLLDMTSPDFERDLILMWHGGGGPLYMAKDDAAWINHPMIGRGTEAGPIFGAIADYEFAYGDCTILRIARDGTAYFVVEGNVSEGPASGFTGCRGWIGNFSDETGPRSARDVVTTVLEHGLEHHFILLHGLNRALFEEFCGWCGVTTLPVITAHNKLPRGYVS